MTILSVGCDNPGCPERTESEALYIGCDGNIYDADQWEASLRHDAKLSGWLRDGCRDFCSQACLVACVVGEPAEMLAKSMAV